MVWVVYSEPVYVLLVSGGKMKDKGESLTVFNVLLLPIVIDQLNPQYNSNQILKIWWEEKTIFWIRGYWDKN